MNLCKEEELILLKQLLDIETLCNDCEGMIDGKSFISDERERYLKMAMKIDPNDPEVVKK